MLQLIFQSDLYNAVNFMRTKHAQSAHIWFCAEWEQYMNKFIWIYMNLHEFPHFSFTLTVNE